MLIRRHIFIGLTWTYAILNSEFAMASLEAGDFTKNSDTFCRLKLELKKDQCHTVGADSEILSGQTDVFQFSVGENANVTKSFDLVNFAGKGQNQKKSELMSSMQLQGISQIDINWKAARVKNSNRNVASPLFMDLSVDVKLRDYPVVIKGQAKYVGDATFFEISPNVTFTLDDEPIILKLTGQCNPYLKSK